MRYIVLVPILVLALTTNAQDGASNVTGAGPVGGTQGIMCYVCDVVADVECVSLSSFKSRFTKMKSCKTGCAVRLGEYGKIGDYDKTNVLARGCDDLAKCEESNVNCCKCNFDGCNINNYCSTANALHPKVIAALVFCLAREYRINLL